MAEVFRILRAPCQRCGTHHDPPAIDPERHIAESLQLAADGLREVVARTPVAPPRDLAEALRNGAYRTEPTVARARTVNAHGIPEVPDLNALIRAARQGDTHVRQHELAVAPSRVTTANGTPPAPDLNALMRVARQGGAQ